MARAKKRYILLSDGSQMSEDVARAVSESGAESETLRWADDIAGALEREADAVVLANPKALDARMARGCLEKAGGLMSRTPLIGILDGGGSADDLEPLRYLDDFLLGFGGLGELGTRVEVCRLRNGTWGECLVAGDLVIDLDAHRVFLKGKPLDFTYKEFELLKKLASKPGRAFTREELMTSIWGYDYMGGTRTVDVHVRRLRSKIEEHRRYIETVHGIGYRFID